MCVCVYIYILYMYNTVFFHMKITALKTLQKVSIKIVASAIYNYLFFFLYIHALLLKTKKLL